MDNQNQFLEKTKEHFSFLPIISLLLLLISSFFNVLYYSFFDIQIVSYTDISEYLILFFSESFLMILYLAYFLGTLYFSWRIYHFDLKRKRINIEKETTLKKAEYRILWPPKVSFFLLTLFVTANVFISTLMSFSNQYLFELLFFLSIACIVIFLDIFYDLICMSLKKKSSNPIKISLILAFSIAFFIGVPYSRSKRVKSGFNTKEITFTHNTETISTNSELAYIGENQNYFFLYSKADSTSIIYPKNNTSKISIKNK